jgi:hypothetical protein
MRKHRNLAQLSARKRFHLLARYARDPAVLADFYPIDPSADEQSQWRDALWPSGHRAKKSMENLDFFTQTNNNNS